MVIRGGARLKQAAEGWAGLFSIFVVFVLKGALLMRKINRDPACSFVSIQVVYLRRNLFNLFMLATLANSDDELVFEMENIYEN